MVTYVPSVCLNTSHHIQINCSRHNPHTHRNTNMHIYLITGYERENVYVLILDYYN